MPVVMATWYCSTCGRYSTRCGANRGFKRCLAGCGSRRGASGERQPPRRRNPRRVAWAEISDYRQIIDAVAQVRSFNRTVTQHIGALESRFLGRDRSLGASRLLFEIGVQGMEVRRLRARLDLDSGYVSRLLRSLEAEGLVRTGPASDDARVRVARLTAAGRREL